MRVIKLFLIALGFFYTIGAITIGGEIFYRLIFGKASHSTSAVFQVPNFAVEVTLERRAIHLFLAEYERTIILRVNGKEVSRKEAAIDTGGYSRMNVHQISPTEYFLSGDISHDRYELNVVQQEINEVILKEKPSTAKFVGAFDVDEKRKWRFISAAERKEQKSKL